MLSPLAPGLTAGAGGAHRKALDLELPAVPEFLERDKEANDRWKLVDGIEAAL